MGRRATLTFTVFELVNDRLREVYVGRTSEMVFAAEYSLRRSPAPAIEHWNLDDVRPARSLEFDLDDEDAERFIADYVSAALPNGWRFLD